MDRSVSTPANAHVSIVYLGRLDRQRQRFGFDVGAVGLDAGYATSGIAKGLEVVAFSALPAIEDRPRRGPA